MLRHKLKEFEQSLFSQIRNSSTRFVNPYIPPTESLLSFGWQLRQSRVAPSEASLVLLPLHDQAAPIVKAEFYGPFCQFSNTLPFKTPFRQPPPAAHWSALIPEVCYWTPNLPFIYRLTLKFANDREISLGVAVKRIGLKEHSLLLDGERYVMRGFGIEGLGLESAGDEIWSSLREMRSVLILGELVPQICWRASWEGLPLLWDSRDRVPTISQLHEALTWPALCGVIAKPEAFADRELAAEAEVCLWLYDMTDVDLLSADMPWRAEWNLNPVISLAPAHELIGYSSCLFLMLQQPLDSAQSAEERRRSCDQLQAETAALCSRIGINCHISGYLLV